MIIDYAGSQVEDSDVAKQLVGSILCLPTVGASQLNFTTSQIL